MLTIVVDRRMIPRETPEAVRAELTELTRQALSTEPGYSWSVDPLHRPFTPVDVSSDSPFAGRLVRIAEQETGREVPIIGTPCGSDVRNLVHDAGIEAITFGAGDVRGCHCPQRASAGRRPSDGGNGHHSRRGRDPAGAMTEPQVAVYINPEGADVGPAAALLEGSGFRVLIESLHSEHELTELLGHAQPTALLLLVTYLPVTDAVLAAAPSLRIVACSSVGFDHIDLEAARRHGVWVTNVPDAATEEVAASALAMALSLVRHLSSWIAMSATAAGTTRPPGSRRASRRSRLALWEWVESAGVWRRWPGACSAA